MIKFKNIDWFVQILYPLAVILMEAFWVYPWLLWLGVWPTFAELRPALSLATVIIVLALSLFLTRVFFTGKWSLGRLRVVLVACGLAAILLALRLEYGGNYALFDGRWLAYAGKMLGAAVTRLYPITLAIPVLVYLWWRGIMLGRATNYLSNIYSSFVAGMIALAVLFIFWQLSSYSGIFAAPAGSVGVYVIGFFFCGLMSIAMRNLALMRGQMPREDASLTSVWRWLPMLLGASGGIVIISLVAASLFSFQLLAGIGHGFGVFFTFIIKILNYLIVPLNYLVDGFFYLLRLMVSWLRTGAPVPGITGNGTLEQQPQAVNINVPPEVLLVIKWLIAAAVVTAVIYFLAKAVNRYRASLSSGDEVEEINESLFSWNGLKDDLQLFLDGVKHRFERRPGAAKADVDLTRDDESLTLGIRELYKHLLWEAGGYGVMRWKQETPEEYAVRLAANIPESDGPIREITGLYEDVRYGDKQADTGQVAHANILWRWLRKRLRKSGEG